MRHTRLSSSRDDRGQNPRRESGPLESGRALLRVSGRESSFRDEEPRRNVPQNLQGKREEILLVKSVGMKLRPD